MRPDRTTIDDIVTLAEDRKTALLAVVDGSARGNNRADICGDLEKAIKNKVWQTQDELIFLSFMFGSLSGSQITVDMMEHLPDILKGMSVAEAITKVEKDLDEVTGK